MYNYTDINNLIQGHVGIVDPDAEEKKQIFNMYFIFTIYRVVILLAEDYDFFEGEFTSLLGFDKKIPKDATNFTGDRIPDITRSVEWVS